MRRFLTYLNQRRPISTAILFYLVTDLADIVSTLLCAGQATMESNHFMRDANYNFLIGHGLIVKGVAFILWCALCAAIYESMYRLNLKLAQAVTALLFVAPAALVLPAVANNFFLYLHFYQP